jgi:nitrile hydratase accessory protein
LSDGDRIPGRVLPPELGDDGGPGFAEPWQAQAFAMTVKLHEAGVFTWPEWTEALAAEIKAAGAHDSGEDYYDHWLTALEKLVEAKGVMTRPERLERRDAWDAAARATPHGQPIEIKLN